MQRIPLLAGPRVQLASVPPGAAVLHPRPPAAGLDDVREAVGEALRFPLAGSPLAELVRPGSRVTIVVEPPSLPIPGAQQDPRQDAIAAAVDALVGRGVRLEQQTILVAGGLQRRLSPREIGNLVSPEFRRRFRGRVIVHDAEHETLVELAPGLRVNAALVESDLVLLVTAAETVRHGGPVTLLAASGAEALRGGVEGASLLETSASPLWARAVALERTLADRVPVLGVSLALNLPVPTGALRGYPYDEDAVERLAASVARRGLSLVPAPIRRAAIKRIPLALTAFSVFAGPPSVAHAEALLRGIELRAATLEEPLDAIVVGIPPTTAALPRERPNPLSVAYLGLGLALRLWRDSSPIVPGGTVILLHHFRRTFAVPTQNPYRDLFRDPLFGRDPEAIVQAERHVADEQARDQYRCGRTCHPLLPFAEWEATRPAAWRAGAVLVAGCRDAVAARQLGFVPTHGLGAALEMARGRAGGSARIGFLLAPPYFPLLVGTRA